jgi:alanyl-tRNA synthetase
LRELASALIERGDVVALLRSAGTDAPGPVVFARGADADADMGRLLSLAAGQTGGKGGGKPDFAQGSLTAEGLLAARDSIINGRLS